MNRDDQRLAEDRAVAKARIKELWRDIRYDLEELLCIVYTLLPGRRGK